MRATGANRKANFAVPNLWPRKSTTKMAIDIGIVSLVTDGLATAIPPTAEVTDTAGVNMPSAIVRLVPNRHYFTVSHHFS
jgi:hypothetical protein